jgi:hypothetical protein
MLVPVVIPDSVINSIKSKFPLNLLQPNPRETRTRTFLRLIGGTLLFGAIIGLLGGGVATAAWLLQSK